MKHRIYVLMVLVLLCVLTPSIRTGQADSKTSIRKGPPFGNGELPVEAVLPEALHRIEESAFEGTGIIDLHLRENVVTIENKAFAEMGNLHFLYMPVFPYSMSEDVLSGSSKVVIFSFVSKPGSEWAKQLNIPFAPISALSGERGSRWYLIQSIRQDKIQVEKGKGSYSEAEANYILTHTRRTGRTIGELKASHFKGIAAQHIQSRYFP